MRITFCLVAILTSLFLTSGTAESMPIGKVNDSMIVSTDWLAQHLKDEHLVLLQVGDRKEFEAAHIPAAQFIQSADISTPRGQGLTLELPPVEQLKATFEKFG